MELKRSLSFGMPFNVLMKFKTFAFGLCLNLIGLNVKGYHYTFITQTTVIYACLYFKQNIYACEGNSFYGNLAYFRCILVFKLQNSIE